MLPQSSPSFTRGAKVFSSFSRRLSIVLIVIRHAYRVELFRRVAQPLRRIQPLLHHPARRTPRGSPAAELGRHPRSRLAPISRLCGLCFAPVSICDSSALPPLRPL